MQVCAAPRIAHYPLALYVRRGRRLHLGRFLSCWEQVLAFSFLHELVLSYTELFNRNAYFILRYFDE